MSEKSQEIYRIAHGLYSQKPDWVTFFREVLGLGGLVRQAYPTPEALVEFEKTEAYMEIQHMLAELRGGPQAPNEEEEPTRVITVRLPKSLHESLRAEAHERKTSMNKLCISKLLLVVDQELVPHETFSSDTNNRSREPATVGAE
jgi:predicted HicB family RNase H-like nuclease